MFKDSYKLQKPIALLQKDFINPLDRMDYFYDGWMRFLELQKLYSLLL